MEPSDALLVARIRRTAFGAWLSALACGVLAIGAKAAGFQTLGGVLLGLVWISGITFFGCVALLMLSAVVLLATGQALVAEAAYDTDHESALWIARVTKWVAASFMAATPIIFAIMIYKGGVGSVPVHVNRQIVQVNNVVASLSFCVFWLTISYVIFRMTKHRLKSYAR